MGAGVKDQRAELAQEAPPPAGGWGLEGRVREPGEVNMVTLPRAGQLDPCKTG